MQINTAKFVISSPRADMCPKTNEPEYAFIGRSNVGKSSLINMITGHNKLAMTSSTPGKTMTYGKNGSKFCAKCTMKKYPNYDVTFSFDGYNWEECEKFLNK